MSAGAAYERLLDALHEHGARVVGSGDRVRAQCPAHDSRGLSLVVSGNDAGAGAHCFAGCPVEDVMAALGLSMRDLFDQQAASGYLPPRRRSRAPINPLGDPEHWCDRALQQERLESDADYQARRAAAIAAAAPRPGDHPGGPVPAGGRQ